MPARTQTRNGMTLMAKPFADTQQDRAILRNMISDALRAGRKIEVEVRSKNILKPKKTFYLWMDQGAYLSGNKAHAKRCKTEPTTKNHLKK